MPEIRYPEIAASEVDTTPPQIVITRPVEGSTVTGKVEVDFWAFDWGGLSGYYDLHVDGLIVASLTPKSHRRYFQWTSHSGSHVLTISSKDTSGNLGTSVGVNVTVA